MLATSLHLIPINAHHMMMLFELMCKLSKQLMAAGCCCDNSAVGCSLSRAPPVILSGINRCDSQQGDSISNTVKLSKTACMGDNLIIQTTTSQYFITNVIKFPGPLLFLCSMQQKAEEEPRNTTLQTIYYLCNLAKYSHCASETTLASSKLQYMQVSEVIESALAVLS